MNKHNDGAIVLAQLKKLLVISIIFLLVQGIICLLSYGIIKLSGNIDVMDLMLIISSSLFIGFFSGK